MGYTHYWKTKNTPAQRQGYLMACPTIAKIVKRYIDILQYECDDAGLPVVNAERIRFNGIEDDGHETFLIELGGMELTSDGFYAVDKDDSLDGTWDEAIKNVDKLYGIKTKKIIKDREVTTHYNGQDKYRDCVDLVCYIDGVTPYIHKQIRIVKVESKSNPGTYHKVALYKDGDAICTCDGFKYRNTCRHIKEAGF